MVEYFYQNYLFLLNFPLDCEALCVCLCFLFFFGLYSVVLDPIDFHWTNTSLKYLPLCFTEERKSYSFGTTRGQVNYEIIFIFR